MKCEMITVHPDEHVEHECDGEAVVRVETVPTCEKHRKAFEESGGYCILPLDSSEEDYRAEVARLRDLNLY